MNFMMRSHVRRRKYKACEIKVSIRAHVYTTTSKIKKKKEINKTERPIYLV